MASNFTKRNKKDEPVSLGTELLKAAAEILNAPPVDVEPNMAYDVYYDPATKKHLAVVISYNIETGAAKIEKTTELRRGVALIYLNQKSALQTLTRKK